MQASSAAFRTALNTTTGVLIVGAGPTGLALACDLRSRGIDITIVDKASGPATTSRALALKPRGTETLDRLGALGDLPQRAVDMTGLSLHAGGRELMRVDVSAMMEGVANVGPLIIGQTEIEAQLRTRLGELQRQVAWGTELVDVAQTGSGVAATLRSGGGETVVHADWMVGCDGAHSRTRKLAGIGFEGTAFAEKFLLADVAMDWARSQRESIGWLHADGVFAAVPLPGPNTWRLMVELAAEVGGTSGHAGSILPEAEAITILERLLPQRAGDHTTRISNPSWVSLFRFHRRLASSYRRGRILLAGDAAHIHSPFGGEGMNTGLGDAYNLGWKLAMVMRGQASDSLIDTYEAERRPVASDVLKRTTNKTNVILGKSVSARLVRDCLLLPMLKLMLKMPAVRRKMMAKGSQLGVNYRGGPLAREAKFMARLAGAVQSGPKPGDRAPDAPCHAHPPGEPTTLGRETCTGWALLLFGGHDENLAACAQTARSRLGKTVRVIRIVPNAEAVDHAPSSLVDATLVDSNATIGDLYGLHGHDVVLVRPDGHLAWRSASPRVSELTRWLSRVCDENEAPAPSSRALRPSVSVGALDRRVSD